MLVIASAKTPLNFEAVRMAFTYFLQFFLLRFCEINLYVKLTTYPAFVFFQMKTVSVALVLCLNVGVDPPDVLKTSPCARLECWIG